jgi:hypothetical protein
VIYLIRLRQAKFESLARFLECWAFKYRNAIGPLARRQPS